MGASGSLHGADTAAERARPCGMAPLALSGRRTDARMFNNWNLDRVIAPAQWMG